MFVDCELMRFYDATTLVTAATEAAAVALAFAEAAFPRNLGLAFSALRTPP